MPQDISATPRRGKTKANDRNQSTNEPAPKLTMETPATDSDTHENTLEQLKKDISNEGGLIKNANDARKYLDTTGLSPTDATITPGNITEILLTLVATSSTKRTANEKIPEKMANIIKAAALILDDITTITTNTRNVEHEPKTGHENTPHNSLHKDIKDQLETNANLLQQAAKNQEEATDKTNALLARMERICEQTEKSIGEALNTATEATKTTTPYRDALLNGRSYTSPQTPQTASQLRIQNRINIKSRQVLIEFKADAHTDFAKTDQPNPKPTNLVIKETINTRLSAPEDRSGPLPKDVVVRTISSYGNNRMMIEMNSGEAATWMRTHLDRIIGNILKCPVKLLTCTYIVIARFIPVTFDPSPAGLKEIEDAVDLPNGSIQDASWVKHPSKRTGHQKVANLKIFCTTPEAANTLINGPVYIAGSRICIQKDIRSPRVCNKCQRYGHIVKDCNATSDVCGKCGKTHPTSTCRERNECKCTPCGSTDHSTNYTNCPIYHQHERSMMDKNPEIISPYYLTNEEWTWGSRPYATDSFPPTTAAHLPPIATHFPPTAAHLPPVAAHPPRARLPPIAAHFLKRNTNQGNRTSTTSTTHQQTLQFQAVPAVSPAQKPSSVIDLTEENSPQGAGTSTKIPQ